MRVPLARHDGVLSAQRAHSAETLLNAARTGCPELRVQMFDGICSRIPVTRIFQCVVGAQPELVEPLRAALGALAPRLGDSG